MPTYEYTSEDGTRTELLRRPVDLRDAPTFVDGIRLFRRTIPSRITVGAGTPPESMGNKLARGYRALENAGQFKEGKGNYLPLKTIKEAIATPDAPEPIAVES